MKPDPQQTKKNLSEDLKTFEELPAKTRELHLLAEDAEKSTGSERADTDRLIRKKSQ